MIRSMSDKQMLVQYEYDKKPWVNARGERFATFNEGADASDPFDASGALSLDLRPEYIPSPDPRPWQHKGVGEHFPTRISIHDKFRPRPWGTFTPDPEFVRSGMNPILSAFRDEQRSYSVMGDEAGQFRDYLYWLDKNSNGMEIFHATPEQVVSARVILDRLARLQEVSA